MFKYFNPNPLYDGNKKGWKSVDCAVRSICAATGKDWLTIYNLLSIAGRQTFSMPHELSVYRKVVLDLGFRLIKNCKKGELKIKDLVQLSKKNNDIYLCKVNNHYTCCNNGILLDTWDCSECEVTQYWIKLK